MAFTSGSWWISSEGKAEVQDEVVTQRGGQARRAVRFKEIDRRTLSLRAVGIDDRVNDPGSSIKDSCRCWNVPQAGFPPPTVEDPDSITDWMLAGSDYRYDPDSGEIRVEATAIRSGADWDQVVSVNASGDL